MAEKSKILIIGGTGYIGKYIVEASAKAGHPTFALVRESTASNPEKSQVIESFKSFGATLVYGDIYHHESLVKAIKQVDIVISAVGSQQIADQVKIIAAIKEAGNIKRFLPSEFGSDVDRVHAVEPAASFFGLKANIRRSIEAEGVPYTAIVSNGFAGYFLPNLGQTGATAPPREKVYVNASNVDDYLVELITRPAADPNAGEVYYRLLTRFMFNQSKYTLDSVLSELSCPLLWLWGDLDPY